jgi:hypothetical protein
VTAVTLPLLFTVPYDRKTAPPAPLRLSRQPPRQRLTTVHDQPPSSSLGRNRKLCLARPQDLASGGGVRLARPPDSASTPVSGGIASSPDPSLDHKRSLCLDRPRARTNCADRGCIIPLLLACSGYKEQDRRPIWLTPATGNDGAPRAP